MEPIYEIFIYETDQGVKPYLKWLAKVRNAVALVQIDRRLKRLADGNFGDCRSLHGGLFELRLDVGPGYRVYFSTYRGKIVILFAGGDKSSQDADIQKAFEYKKDYEAKND